MVYWAVLGTLPCDLWAHRHLWFLSLGAFHLAEKNGVAVIWQLCVQVRSHYAQRGLQATGRGGQQMLLSAGSKRMGEMLFTPPPARCGKRPVICGGLPAAQQNSWHSSCSVNTCWIHEWMNECIWCRTTLLGKLEECDILDLILQPSSAQSYLPQSGAAWIVLTLAENSVLAPPAISPVTRAFGWRGPTMWNAPLREDGQHRHQPAKVTRHASARAAPLETSPTIVTNT